MTLSLKSKIFKASIVLGFFSFIADLVALIRDRILAANFGASRTLDIYYSAFKIPDLIFNLLILGAVSSAFIPIFIAHYKDDEKRAWRISQNFMSVAFVAVVIVSGIMFFAAKWLMPILVPGFSGANRELATKLLQLMLLSPIIFSVSTILGSILQSLERFWAYAIAPVFYNLGIIIGALYIAPFVQARGVDEVMGLGLGVILGALMHLVIQLIAAVRAGFRFKFIFEFVDESFKKILKLMVPRTLGLGAYSIDSVVINAIASTLGAGSIAIFNFANNLQFVPIAVVGVSVATAVFPRLSLHASSSEKGEFMKKLKDSLAGTAILVGIVAALMYFFSELIIKLIFGVGLFRGASIENTAAILSIFMFGIVAQSLIPILSRAFYALQNTKTPVIISIVSIIVNVSLASYFTFVLGWGIRGIASAFAIAGNVNFALLGYSFYKFTKRAF